MRDTDTDSAAAEWRGRPAWHYERLRGGKSHRSIAHAIRPDNPTAAKSALANLRGGSWPGPVFMKSLADYFGVDPGRFYSPRWGT